MTGTVARTGSGRDRKQFGATMAEPRIDYGRMLGLLDTEVRLLGDAAHQAPRDLVVPACPGLTLGETVRHVGGVYRSATGWLTHGAWQDVRRHEPAPGQAPDEYLHAEFARLRGQLAAHGGATRCPTWFPPQQHYGFWARRMLHETVLHRCDVQSAARREQHPILADVAVDGSDEVLSVWFGHRLGELGITATKTASVLLETADCRWLVRMSRNGVDAHTVAMVGSGAERPVEGQARAAGAATGGRRMPSVDAVVRARPAELYLWLWGRLPTRREFVEVGGGAESADAVAQLWALLRLATR